MIEIKFRAWDKLNKRMLFTNSTSSGRVWYPWGFQMEHNRDLRSHSFNCEIMQFTGLKDKNGVEVYFQDVCKYHDDAGNPQIGVFKDYRYFKGHIEAVGGDDEGNQDVELHPDYEIEVIGNIYENPELLEAK